LTRRVCITLASALLLTFVAAPLLNAGVIDDNGGPNTNTGIPMESWAAEDFLVLSGGTVASVGFYYQTYAGIVGWDQNVSYIITTDPSGSGETLASGAGIHVAAVDSGMPWCCGGNAWLVTFDLQSPFDAAAGTRYWLMLQASSTGSSWWVTTDDNGTPGSWYYGYPSPYHLAFYLSDSATDGAVPEPASILLTGIGTLTFVALRRRK